MGLEDSYETLRAQLTIEVGKFFSPAGNLSIGAGTIYSNVRYPRFDSAKNLFATVAGLVYVLTHECDVDQANERPFNSELLVCPIIPFEIFVEEYEKVLPEEKLRGFIGNLASRNVSRLIYIPTIPNSLPYGGLLYLNQISTTSLPVFSLPGVQQISAVTAYGLRVVDQSLNNHLFRPKAERLAFQY